MEIKPVELQVIRESFKKDYGILFSENEAKEALINLVNFFDLLWRFDQDDKQKLKEMEANRYEK